MLGPPNASGFIRLRAAHSIENRNQRKLKENRKENKKKKNISYLLSIKSSLHLSGLETRFITSFHEILLNGDYLLFFGDIQHQQPHVSET